ncbi:unnamed protein product, partial [Amoebophrya sp. A120]
QVHLEKIKTPGLISALPSMEDLGPAQQRKTFVIIGATRSTGAGGGAADVDGGATGRSSPARSSAAGSGSGKLNSLARDPVRLFRELYPDGETYNVVRIATCDANFNQVVGMGPPGSRRARDRELELEETTHRPRHAEAEPDADLHPLPPDKGVQKLCLTRESDLARVANFFSARFSKDRDHVVVLIQGSHSLTTAVSTSSGSRAKSESGSVVRATSAAEQAGAPAGSSQSQSSDGGPAVEVTAGSSAATMAAEPLRDPSPRIPARDASYFLLRHLLQAG